MRRQIAATLLAALWLGGCSFSDGPGRPLSDPQDIPDAVPRQEAPSRYGNPDSYTVFGRTYRTLERADGYRERGIASWYGRKFHGRRTSSGEPYDMYAMTAAHRSLPLPSYVRVTHLGSGRQVVVRVNDRGPFVKNRLIDLSYAAAGKLGMTETGTAPVKVEALAPAGPAVAAAATVAAPAEVRYFLQVGAFSERGNALALLERLDRSGLDTPVSLSRSAGSDGLYRVRLGPLADVTAVDRVSSRLGAHGIDDAHVVVVE